MRMTSMTVTSGRRGRRLEDDHAQTVKPAGLRERYWRRRSTLLFLAVTTAVALAAPGGSAEEPPRPPTTQGGDAPPPASETAPRTQPALADAFNVAVFGKGSFDAHGVANALNTDPRIVATVVPPGTVSSGLPGYAALVVRLGAPKLPTARMRHGLRKFVRNGGGVVGEWWGAGALLSDVFGGAPNDHASPKRSVFLFAGVASGGGMIETDHPVQMTRAHPVTAGLPDVLQAGGSTEYFVQSLRPRDLSLKTIATYEFSGETYPAIEVGRTSGARITLIYFDAGDEPAQPDITRLFINSVYWAAS